MFRSFIERQVFEEPYAILILLAAATVWLLVRGRNKPLAERLPALALPPILALAVLVASDMVETEREALFGSVRDLVAKAQARDAEAVSAAVSASYHFEGLDNPEVEQLIHRGIRRTPFKYIDIKSLDAERDNGEWRVELSLSVGFKPRKGWPKHVYSEWLLWFREEGGVYRMVGIRPTRINLNKAGPLKQFSKRIR